MMNEVPKSSGEREFRSGMIALVGATNAGKSTLLNALLGKKVSIVSAKAHTTRNRILGIKDAPNAQLVFVDTPGFTAGKGGGRRSRGEMSQFTSRVLHDSVLGVDVIAWVIDASSCIRRTDSLESLIHKFKERRIGRPAFIILNKVDLCRKDALLPLFAQLAQTFPADDGQLSVEIVPVSALRADGLEVVEQLLIERLPSGERLFPEGEVSDQPEDFLAAEIVREKLFAALHDEIPYSVAVRIESWEDEEALIKIRAVILVERDSQKFVVIGKQGSLLKSIGQAARLELEQIFGVQVYLELFVRVEEAWTKSAKGLTRAGYSRIE